MLAKKLIIFDYSGTLSLESTLFGRPDYLMKQLKESGLMDLGVTSPTIFWEQIVNPTWAAAGMPLPLLLRSVHCCAADERRKRHDAAADPGIDLR